MKKGIAYDEIMSIEAPKQEPDTAPAPAPAPERATAPKPKQAPAESVYTITEIAQNAKRLFGVNQDVAMAALETANIKECSITAARTNIKNFAERKVNS